MTYRIRITEEAEVKMDYPVSSAKRVAAQIEPIIKGLTTRGIENFKIEILAQNNRLPNPSGNDPKTTMHFVRKLRRAA